MPHYVVNRTMDALNERKKSLNGAKVLILGLAYKPDIDDVRESPSLELIELLKDRGAKVDYNDPYVPQTHKMREYNLKMSSVKLTAAKLKSYDVVLISTNHSDYNYKWIVKNSRLVVDTRNACVSVKTGKNKIVKA
jgi:UDP-N-acetyl-D-glucosamine dehydrogenase